MPMLPDFEIVIRDMHRHANLAQNMATEHICLLVYAFFGWMLPHNSLLLKTVAMLTVAWTQAQCRLGIG
jgi:hypothetical protein